MAVTRTPPAGKMGDRWTALSHWNVHDNLSLLSCNDTVFHMSIVSVHQCRAAWATISAINLTLVCIVEDTFGPWVTGIAIWVAAIAMKIYLYFPVKTLYFICVRSRWNCVQRRNNFNGAFEVFFFRLLIIKINTKTHNMFRLLRPRKMPSGSGESGFNCRYLIGNQKSIWRKLCHCLQYCTLCHFIIIPK